jgi:tetratricopeptide (TPR) repeat protein
VVLAAITLAAIVLRNRAPYLIAGWLWFVGTLVPVIGLVAIGSQSMADRYSYFAYFDLFIAIAFGATEIAAGLRIHPKTVAAAGVLAIVIYAAAAFCQTDYWKNSGSLFTHALAVTADNAMAEYSLGQTLELTRPERAIPHLRRSLDLLDRDAARGQSPPNWQSQARVGLGTSRLVLAARNKPLPAGAVEEAIRDLQWALAIDARTPHAANNLAVAQQMLAASQQPPQ